MKTNFRQHLKPLGILVGVWGAFWLIYFVANQPPELTNPVTINTGEISKVVFSPDGGLIASAHTDGLIRLWDTLTHQLITEMYAPIRHQCQTDVVALDFSPDGRWLAAALRGEVQVWEVSTGEQLLSIDIHEPYRCMVTDARFNPDGTKILTSGTGSRILWDAVTGELTDYVGHYTGSRIAFHPGGRWVASGQTADYTGFYIYDVNDINVQIFVPIPDAQPARNLYDIEFSPDGQLIAAAHHSGNFYVWDVAHLPEVGEPITASNHPDEANTALSVTFSPTRDLLMVGDSFPGNAVWKINRGNGELSLSKLVNVRSSGGADFSPDGRWMAAAGSGGIQLWDVSQLGK